MYIWFKIVFASLNVAHYILTYFETTDKSCRWMQNMQANLDPSSDPCAEMQGTGLSYPAMYDY
jgi:hypothetical protein